MNDYELIQKVKNGDEASFTLLIDKYGTYVTAVIAKVCNKAFSSQDIEELAADVFLALWHHACDITDDRELKPWLAKVARNKTISQFRKVSKNHDNAALALDESILVLETNITDELAVKRELETIINQAVLDMGQPDGEIFTRFYFLNEKISQIACQLDIKQGTIKTKLRRSRDQIKKLFAERGYTYHED